MHTVVMRGAHDDPAARGSLGRWREQRVQLARGQWRQEDRAGAVRSSGWWESVTVTWSPAAAPERRSALWPRALTAAFDAVAPSIAELAAASARGWLERQHRRRAGLPSPRRPLPAIHRALPRSGRIR